MANDTGSQPGPTADHANACGELLECGEHLPRGARDRILALGSRATQPLLEILTDPDLPMASAPGGGNAPIHAVDLLTELRAVEAVEPMLKVLAETDGLDILHDRITTRLPRLGAAVLEPALGAYEASDDEDYRMSLRAIVAELGVLDERVFTILVDDLFRQPDTAGNLAAYGDPRARPFLSDALDRIPVEENPDHPFANQGIIEVVAAIEELGGKLTPSQRAKVNQVDAIGQAFRRRLFASPGRNSGEPARRANKIGRNQPCWCGSGKKYKKCHEAADEGRGIVEDPQPSVVGVMDRRSGR